MKYSLTLSALCALMLTGCAGVKSDFDCDATTSDRCMTMTEANKLAIDKTERSDTGKVAVGALPSLVDIPLTATPVSRGGSPIRLAPTPPVRATLPAPVSIKTTSTPFARRPAVVSTPVSYGVACAPRCDTPGSVPAVRRAEKVASVWIAPWTDRDDAFHQPGRVSFVVSGSDWALPSRIE